jgi:hypothetical protein
MKHLLKLLFVVASLSLCGRLCAQGVVVFGEKDFFTVGPASAPSGPAEPDRARFYDACRADMTRQAALEDSMELVSPPAWGKTVSASTHGTIDFHSSFAQGFVCRLSLSHLLANHEYILTLNGNPSKAGNALLPSSVANNEQEKYMDFLVIRTDAHGGYSERLGIFLKPGNYDVRCYVKDTGDFKIVLYRDFFKFQVL